MVALEPELEELTPEPPKEPTSPLDQLEHLTNEDRVFLENVAGHLPLLADLTHADAVLFARSGDQVVVIAQAQPVPVPSPYTQPVEVGRSMTREEAPMVFRVLVDGRRNQVTTTVIRGAPVLQEVFAIHNERGEPIGALRSEMLLIEHERQRKRDAIFRRAIARTRDLIVAGQMRGGQKLGRLGVHDGVMVIDSTGRIEYLSAPAEHLYRRLGYADNLVKSQLQELDTNEHICFRAMELGVCLERKVQEQDLVWIKRVVPLVSPDETSWLARWPGRRRAFQMGAVVAIQDVTDDLQNEKELKIKTAMIQEIHHRVKNNLQTIAALLRLQARRTDNPEVADQLRESVGRIISIAVVHEFLSHEENSVINIHEVSNRILAEVRNGVLDRNRPITLCLEGTRNFLLPAQQATSCALIINELVQNAVDHAFVGLAGGSIVVRLGEQGDSLYIEIQDDGRGLPEDFDAMHQGGLGLQIVRSLVREDLKGEVELLRKTNGEGVQVFVSFPKWIAKAE